MTAEVVLYLTLDSMSPQLPFYVIVVTNIMIYVNVTKQTLPVFGEVRPHLGHSPDGYHVVGGGVVVVDVGFDPQVPQLFPVLNH